MVFHLVLYFITLLFFSLFLKIGIFLVQDKLDELLGFKNTLLGFIKDN